MAAVEDWLQAFPEMNCIVAMSDEMAIAATNVLQAAKKSLGDCIVIGIDGSPNAQNCLQDGTLSATVYTSKKAEAKFTIDYAERIIKGEKLAGQTIDPGQMISALMVKDNVQQILSRDR
jgi:ABC-type sugar transport system substrate-binding protein